MIISLIYQQTAIHPRACLMFWCFGDVDRDDIGHVKHKGGKASDSNQSWQLETHRDKIWTQQVSGRVSQSLTTNKRIDKIKGSLHEANRENTIDSTLRTTVRCAISVCPFMDTRILILLFST